MTNRELPPEFLALLENVQVKRSRVVVDHILEHGFITTEELETTYGYSHPPRAIRDVREQGIPIETFRVKNEQGRTIAAYRFGDLSKIEAKKFGGRKIFSKQFKQTLLEIQQNRCAICNSHYEDRYLQIDHRIPYEIVGELTREDSTEFMLLCASCNRAKAWSCKHCENTTQHKNPEICKVCYWASPLDYVHIAMHEMRRLDIVFEGDEIELYENLKLLAEQAKMRLSDYIKHLLKND